MDWKDIEKLYDLTASDLGGRLEPVPKHTGPIIGGIALEPDLDEPDYFIRSPPIVSAEFDIEITGPNPKIEISGSGIRSLRLRSEAETALATTLIPVQIKPHEIPIRGDGEGAVIFDAPAGRTKNTGGPGYKLIDYGLTLSSDVQLSAKDSKRWSIKVGITNTTGGKTKGQKYTTFHDFRFTLKLKDVRISIPGEVKKKEDIPLYIETVNAVAYVDPDLKTVELSPFGVWDQGRITIVPGPKFDDALSTPFSNGAALGEWRSDFEYAAKITAKATKRVVESENYHKFQYEIRGIIYGSLVKCWEEGAPIAVIDNAPTAAGKSEPNYDAAAVTSIVLKRKDSSRDVGTVAIITEPIRTLASEQLERLFKFMAFVNEQLPDSLKVTMGFYMGTQEGKGIPRDPSPEVTINQVPINNCPFCGKELKLNYDQKLRRLVPHCVSCQPNRTFPWIYLTISETEQFVPNIVVATLDKLCYEEGRNLGVHSFFGRDFARCPGCRREWPVTARIIKGGARCWICNSVLSMQDVNKSKFSLLIMDEAHVFRGSTGSNAGLYTTSELRLAKRVAGHAPLVMASTATIKKAEELMLNLSGATKAEVLPRMGEEDEDYFKKSNDKHRKFVFACPNVSNRVAIPKAVASVKKAWDAVRAGKEKSSYPEKLPQIVFTKKRQNAENLRNAIQILGDEDKLRMRSEVIHGESTKPEIKQRLKELENNEIDVLFVTVDLIALGLNIPSIKIIHFDGMPEDYAKFVQAYGRAAREKDACGLIFVWLRMNMPGEAYYLERFRDLFLYKKELMPIIPINKWFPQSIRTYATPAALQYSFFTDQRGSIFSPAVAARQFSDQTFLKQLEDFIVGETLGDVEKPEDAEIATKYTRLGLLDLSSYVQNTPTAGKTNVQSLLAEKLPRGIRSQAGEAEVIPTNFSRELMSVRVERSLHSAGFTDAELGLEEE
ncbi:MAG: hypothetical protein JRN62_09530 [Nitrososphaerota archaeon]|nr:hypothetical protein [Nitrososphaerota archaeon]